MKNKKSNKRAIIIVIVTLVVLAVVGVVVERVLARTPDKVVNETLTYLKNGEKEKLASESSEVANSLNEINDTEDEQKFKDTIQAFFSKLEWKIESTEITDDVAKVRISSTNKDFSQFFQKMFQKAYSMILSGTDEEYDEVQEFIDVANEITDTKTVEEVITLNKIDGKWQINFDEAFSNAILPGLKDGMSSFYGTDEETTQELEDSASELQ